MENKVLGVIMYRVVIGIIIVSLAGCSMGHRDPVEIKQELDQVINTNNSRSLDELPASVQADLMPDLSEQIGNESLLSSEKRFHIQAAGIEAKTFFASIVKDTEFNMILHPDLSGQITVNLSDVTLSEVFDAIKNMYGYDIRVNDKVVQVYPASMRTETFTVDYLQLTRAGVSSMSISTSGSSSDSGSDSSGSDTSSSGSDGTRVETQSTSDFWGQLQQSVSALIGEENGRSVTVNPQAGLLTVRALPNEIREVRQFLDISHQRLHRQVILEAKILEVTLNDGYQQGINWSNLSKSIGSGAVSVTKVASVLTAGDSIAELLGGQTNITVSGGGNDDFNVVLNFIETQGDLNVLSSPRITTANNQKAVIKVGVDEYFVTGAETEDVDRDLGDGNVATVPRTNYTIAPFFSGISLDVTPQIDSDNNVLLHVHPAVVDVDGVAADFLNGAPLARSSIRESDSIIRARDGDVVVIGGLMKSNTLDRISKVPFFGDIPGVGHLFRNTNKQTQKTELVILLKPTIVGVHTWQKELERSREILQEWFPDSE